jgi:hypothetical protein
MQNPVYQDQQENSKMEKIQKNPDFSKNLPWVFARLVRKTRKSTNAIY